MFPGEHLVAYWKLSLKGELKIRQTGIKKIGCASTEKVALNHQHVSLISEKGREMGLKRIFLQVMGSFSNKVQVLVFFRTRVTTYVVTIKATCLVTKSRLCEEASK